VRHQIRILICAASVALAALAAFASMKRVSRLPKLVIPAGAIEKSEAIEVGSRRNELLAAASSREHDVTLELDVEAERSPETFYQVFVGTRNVGNIALYGAGIRSEARGEFRPYHVQLVVSEAVAAALRSRSAHTLMIRFVPNAKPKAALTVDQGVIVIGPRLRE
jgi:hypothetical protein